MGYENLRELLSGDFKESNIIFTLTCEPKTTVSYTHLTLPTIA
mgnify:CR=1 FL=1